MFTRVRALALVLAVVASAAIAQVMFPFVPQATSSVAVTGTAQTLSLGTTTLPSTLSQVMLTNVGTQTVFYRTDGTTATTSNGMPVMANARVLISVPFGTTALSVISSTTGSTLYATVGVGQ